MSYLMIMRNSLWHVRGDEKGSHFRWSWTEPGHQVSDVMSASGVGSVMGTLDGFGFSHIVSQVSTVTKFGTALGSQTIISSMPATGTVSLQLMIVHVTAGSGCSAATNSTTVNPLTWTAPGGTVENINPNSNFGFVGNGVVDTGSSTFGSSAFTNNGIQAIVAKSGTAVSYVTASTLASTGCSTTPQYQVYAKAFF